MSNIFQVGIYLRLSRDDKKLGESESISNQRLLLMNYIKDNNLYFVDEYVDDGVSGTTFNRLGFKKMIRDCEKGKINMIITKDTSRLGRDHIEFGYYVERYFPEHNIRYVAVNDGIDTFNNNSANDMLVFKSAFNDMYVKDISNKLRSSLYTKKRNGEFIGAYAPYGFNKSINDKHKLVINIEESKIVKRIFKMFINGYSINKIKDILTYEHIKTPSESKMMHINRHNYHLGVWSTRTINDILKNEIYIGNLVQCKQKKVNYKSKKRIRNNIDNYIVCQNIIEPIIDINTFKIAQNMFKTNKYKRHHIINNLLLKGLVFCKECHHTIGFRRQKQKLKDHEIIRIYGNCNYWAKRKKENVCTPHSIKYDMIESIVLNKIFRLMNIYLNDNKVMNIIKKHQENNKKLSNNKVIILDNQINDLNMKLEKIYFDKLNGIITEDMYVRVSKQLEYQLDELLKQKDSLLNNKKNFNLMEIDTFFENNKPLFIANLIEKIEIDMDNNMDIYYKFSSDI